LILELEEWKSVVGVELLPGDVAALLRSDKFILGPDPNAPGRWQITAKHHVGVARFGSVEIRVAPKLPVHRLLELICTSIDSVRWDDRETLWSEDDDLLATVAATFACQAHKAIARGVLQGYVTREDRILGIRGRIAMGRQLARQSGLPLPIEVTYDDYSPDILENRLLAGACRVLLRLGGFQRATVGALKRLEHGLTDVTPERACAAPPQVTWSRLNDHYRAAVVLARMILRSGSIEDGKDRQTRGSSFLVNMNKVFEDVVGQGIRHALAPAGYSVALQSWAFLDDDQRVKIEPDVLVRRDGKVVAVADVKYKRISKTAGTGDIYQALAYATRFQLPSCTLVFPQPPSVSRLQVGARAVTQVSIDVSQPPGQRMASLEDLARSLCNLVDG
jgi:5-methylcytosine-specific restriction enzyme subunit McrC